MPELPEVETVRAGLEKVVVGAPIVRVAVTGKRSVRRQPIAEFKAALVGRRIVEVCRLGKWLYCRLDDDAHLIIHLRMSGKLTFSGRDEPTEAHTHIVVEFGNDHELRFIDPRTFGEMFVCLDVAENPTGLSVPSALAGVGIDPYRGVVDEAVLGQLLGARRVALKVFLLDQRAIAGIGNIYADEICFAAGLRPDRKTESLSVKDPRKLAQAITEVINEAVRLRGSSLRDESYRDLFGSLGAYQNYHAVYARDGEPCISCGRPIAKARIAGRSAHFCPKCQR